MAMSKVQNANAYPYRTVSASARINEVRIGVSGVVMKMMGERVVIERAKANIKPVRKAPRINGSEIFLNVLPPDAPSEADASSIDGSICCKFAIPDRWPAGLERMT
jgi:hypothetical protein